MKTLLKSGMKRQKVFIVFFLIAFLLIFTIMPLLATSLQHTHSEVESDITYYARGSYDLFVRPHGTEHELEKELGIVPENYIGFGEGGISVAEWKAVKERADIEIAAPVASLGYFTGMTSNIGLKQPEQSTRYLTTFFTTDGIYRYPLSEAYACILLESPKTAKLFDKFESIYSNKELANHCKEVSMVALPATYHLLVGIDPEEEQALTNIDFADISEENPRTGWANDLKIQFQAELIPVMQLTDENVTLEADIQIDTLAIDKQQTKMYRDHLQLDDDFHEEEIEKDHVVITGEAVFTQKFFTDEYQQLLQALLDYPEIKSNSLTANIGSILAPFRQQAVFIHENSKVEELIADGTLHEDMNFIFASQYYTAGHLQYTNKGKSFMIKKVGTENGIPTYREIEKHGITIKEAFETGKTVSFIVDPIGEFSVGKHKQQLASSPLGIYQLAPVRYIGDDKEKNITLRATATPGSFVSPPAKGVTNIKTAALVKGEKPIDAIRVKVAGIDGYTKQAAEKIEKVAKEIEEMGFLVTTVAGASPQKLEVEVEGIGLVEESWTTLGAAGNIISQWNLANVIFAIAFSFTSILYIANRMTFWQVSKQAELILFQQLGWEQKHLLRLSRMEIGSVMILAWLLSFAVCLGLQPILNISSHLYLWLLLIGALAFGFVMLLLTLKLKNLENVQKKKPIVASRRREKLQSLVEINLMFFTRFIRAPFVQLVIVSALSSFVFLTLIETVQQTNLTMLGEYINLQANKWHVLVIIAVYVLALFTLIESLASLFLTRAEEITIFHTLGWKRSHIFKLYLAETAIWTGFAVFLGSVASIAVYATLFPLQTADWLIVGASFLGFYLLLLLTACFTLYRTLQKDMRRKTTRKHVVSSQVPFSK